VGESGNPDKDVSRRALLTTRSPANFSGLLGLLSEKILPIFDIYHCEAQFKSLNNKP